MFFRLIEYGFIIFIMWLVWRSVSHDFEGHWVDETTGVPYEVIWLDGKFHAHASGDKKNFKIDMRNAKYKRLKGKIVWPDGTQWRRMYESKLRHFPHWVDFRNFLIPTTLKGGWYGNLENSYPVFLEFTDIGSNRVAGSLRTGNKKETFTGSLIAHNAILRTSTGDKLKWSWDRYHEATLKIGNQKILMRKLD